MDNYIGNRIALRGAGRMLNIFQILIVGGAVYFAYSVLVMLREIKDLMVEQTEQNEQILDLLEDQSPNKEQW